MDKSSSSEKLEELRELYRNKDFFQFKRKFWLCAFQLEPEDRDKVYKALNKLTPEQTKMPDNIKYALDVLGGKIVD